MKPWTTLLHASALTAVLAVPALADTLKVPAQYPTPVDALLAAQDGDRIVIKGGDWGDIAFLGLTPLPANLEIVGKGKVHFSSITVDGMTNLTLKRLRVTGGDVGIDVMGLSSGVLIERCRIEGAETGVLVQAGSTATLRKNLVLDSSEEGIVLASDGNTLFGNKVSGAMDWGILVTGDGNAVDKNRVESSGPVGIPAIEDGSANTFTRNEVINALGYGIELGGFGNAATQNRIKKSAGHAILVTGTGGHTASKNKIKAPGDDGIKIRDPDPNEVTFDATNNSIVENRIGKASSDGIDCENPDNTIEGNKVKGAGDNGFEFGQQGRDNEVTDNRAKGSGLYGLFDDGGSNTYSGNKFGTVDPEGDQP